MGERIIKKPKIKTVWKEVTSFRLFEGKVWKKRRKRKMEETQKCQYLSITDIQKEYLPISRKKITDICEKVSGCKDDRKSYLCE